MRQVGQQVGRYVVTRLLGQGGMGEVWVASDPLLSREVAVKFIATRSVDEPLLRQRFARELRAMAALTHRSVVRVFDSGVDRGQPYLVMELIHGESVERLLARSGPLGVDRALAIGHDLLDALDHLHASGYVHRDVTPGNVMIERSGRVVLMDLGLVKARTEAPLTQAGIWVGTPRCLAPEVLLGDQADARADLYQVGFLIHEMATGQPPVKASALARAAASNVPALPELDRLLGADDRLRVFLGNALAPRPGLRYPSARRMALDLQAVLRKDELRRITVEAPLEERPAVELPEGLASEYEPVRVVQREPHLVWYEAVKKPGKEPVRLRVTTPGLDLGRLDATLLARIESLPRLAHHGLETPLEVVRAGRGLCLVYEPAAGLTLDALVGAPGSLARRDTGRMAADLARGLAHLHSRGQIHGHIDLEAVRLLPSGEARLCGLELGLLLDGAASPGVAETRKLSLFAAPEQIEGGPASMAADVYSLARVLEYVGGLVDPGRSRGPGDALRLALESDPERRIPDGQALAARLCGRTGRRARPGRLRTLPVAGAVAALAILAAAVILGPRGEGSPVVESSIGWSQVRLSVEARPARKLRLRVGQARSPRVIAGPDVPSVSHTFVVTGLAPGSVHEYELRDGSGEILGKGRWELNSWPPERPRVDLAPNSVTVAITTPVRAMGRLRVWSHDRPGETTATPLDPGPRVDHAYTARLPGPGGSRWFAFEWWLPGGEVLRPAAHSLGGR